ncbi:metallophosphoesterase [bacterium]|nr:MAG: metallophosphoesterase [bacterium]
MPITRRSLLRTASAGFLYAAATQLRAEAQDTVTAQAPAAPVEPVVEPLPFVPGSWTIAVLPDTQIYTMGKFGHHFDNQTRWIADNIKNHNIAYVLHLGDIVNNNNVPQWEVAQKAMKTLDGVIPYAFVTGNHDYGTNGSTNTRDTLLNDYFPYDNYKSWPTLGGVMEAGRMENSYHLFSAGGRDWIIIALEFGPRHNTVAWADKILSQHPDRLGILITHAYMYFDETRYDIATRTDQSWNPHNYPVGKAPEGINDGEELWQKLVTKHPNMVMTLNGHVLNDGLGRLSSPAPNGNVVHQMLVNYQMKKEGGEAYMRLLEFLPDRKTLQVKAYSPSLDKYKTDSQNQFTLDLSTTAARAKTA